MKQPVKFGFIILFTIFLVFGLTFSLRSLLAAWTAPASAPVSNNSVQFINATSSVRQYIGGTGASGGDIAITGDLGVMSLSTSRDLTVGSNFFQVSPTLRRVTLNSNTSPGLTINNDNTGISDSQITFQLNGSVNIFSFGIDDSAVDIFKLSRGGVLGTNDSLVINATGTFGMVYNGNFPTQLNISNTYTGASADAQIRFGFGSDASNPNILFSMGSDESDAGKFKISSSTALGTNDRFVIGGTGNFGFGAAPNDTKGNGGYITAKDIYLRDSGRWLGSGGFPTCNWSGWLGSCPGSTCTISCCGCTYTSVNVFAYYCSGGFLTNFQLLSCTAEGCGDCGSVGGTTPYLFTRSSGDYYIENDFMNTFSSLGDMTPEETRMAYVNNAVDEIFKAKDIYKLKLKPDQKDGKLFLQIREIEPEESYIDKISLIKVIHPKETLAFANAENIEVAKTTITKPFYCQEDNGRDCLKAISGTDNNFIRKDEGGSIILKFKADKKDNYLILSSGINKWLPKPYFNPVDEALSGGLSLKISYLKSGQWHKAERHIHPRSITSFEYEKLPVNSFIDQDKNLIIKIEWTGLHDIDGAAIMSTEPSEYQRENLLLTKAVHSKEGDVKNKISGKDYDYVHTVTGDSIDLEFEQGPLKPEKDQIADYFFESHGYYHGLRTYLYPDVPTGLGYTKEIDKYIKELNEYLEKSGTKYGE